GLGNLNNVSYRTLIAQFADALVKTPVNSLEEAAARWNEHFWHAYATEYKSLLDRVHDLNAKPNRTPVENDELRFYVQTLSGGFCLGGNLLHDRTPTAFEIPYSPVATGPQPARALSPGSTSFWGWPNLMERLLY